MPINRNKNQKSENEAEKERILRTYVHKIHYTSNTGSQGIWERFQWKGANRLGISSHLKVVDILVLVWEYGLQVRLLVHGHHLGEGELVGLEQESLQPPHQQVLCAPSRLTRLTDCAQKRGNITGRYTLRKNRSSSSTEYRIPIWHTQTMPR